MNLAEHRIYSYMSEPLRIIGMTIDELVLGLSCLILFFATSSLFFKTLFLCLTPLSVYLVKRVKKVAVGFSLTSYAHWHLGIRSGLPHNVPPSWKRRWLG